MRSRWRLCRAFSAGPERGAVAVMTALVMVVIVGMSAIAVDLGVQRVSRSDMQSTADTTSLDMVRALARGVTPGTDAWRSALSTSIDGNTTTVGKGITRPASWSAANSVCNAVLCAQATPGYYDSHYEFTTTAPAGVTTYTAVKVDSATAVSRTFGAIFGTGDLPTVRSAVASIAPPAICFDLSTTTAALNTDGSALSPLLKVLLGTDLGLNAVSYDGLVALKSTKVSLLRLIPLLEAKAGVGSVSDLLATNITLVDFLDVLASAVSAGGDTVSASLLNTLMVAVNGLSLSTAVLHPLKLGDILKLATGNGNADGLDADVNVLGLLSAGLQASTTNHAVHSGVGVLGVGDVTLSIIEPPQIACGGVGAVAKSGQIKLGLTLDTNQLGSTTSGLATALEPVLNWLRTSVAHVAALTLDLSFTVGGGSATLTALTCSPSKAVFDVDSAAVDLTTQLALSVGNSVPVWVQDTWLTGHFETSTTSVLTASVGPLTAAVGSSHNTVTFAYPTDGTLPAGQSVPAVPQSILSLGSAAGLIDTTLFGTPLLDGLVDTLVNSLMTHVVQPLVNGLDTYLLTPLVTVVQNLLGLRLGVSNVAVESAPNCSGAQLIQ